MSTKALSLIEHSCRLYAGVLEGNPRPTLVRTLKHQLVYLPQGYTGDDPNLQEHELLRTADDHPYPMAWHMSATDLTSRLSRLREQAPPAVKPLIAELYPDNAPPQVPFVVFRQVSREDISDEEVLAVIDTLKDVEDEPPLVEGVIRALKEKVGVVRIPNLDQYAPTYHACASDLETGAAIRVLKTGWVRDGRVLRKSEVAPAP